MVSFWPFKGHDNSAASFEKLLSGLSLKINKESARNDKLRQRQRRYKVLWTLYTSFAYILAALILTLVTGWRNWNAPEYTGLAGAPVLIFAVRTAIDAGFNYLLAGSQTHLDQLYKQRETAITKLKEATKYNSTQQLLDKYGGAAPPKPSPSPAGKRKPNAPGTPQSAPRPVARTGIAPPPTANIPGRQHFAPASGPSTPQPPNPSQQPPPSPPTDASQTASFAPNAFPSVPLPLPTPQAYAPPTGPAWYDRLLDIVLGEDETAPKNRIVLICSSCRLVNGQAPPGTRALEDLGRWRCGGCGAENGVESEEGRIVRHLAGVEGRGVGEEKGEVEMVEQRGGVKGEVDVDVDVDAHAEAVGDTSPAASTRSKARRRGGEGSE